MFFDLQSYYHALWASWQLSGANKSLLKIFYFWWNNQWCTHRWNGNFWIFMMWFEMSRMICTSLSQIPNDQKTYGSSKNMKSIGFLQKRKNCAQRDSNRRLVIIVPTPYPLDHSFADDGFRAVSSYSNPENHRWKVTTQNTLLEAWDDRFCKKGSWRR
jgi:hypothetical protein